VAGGDDGTVKLKYFMFALSGFRGGDARSPDQGSDQGSE